MQTFHAFVNTKLSFINETHTLLLTANLGICNHTKGISVMKRPQRANLSCQNVCQNLTLFAKIHFFYIKKRGMSSMSRFEIFHM